MKMSIVIFIMHNHPYCPLCPAYHDIRCRTHQGFHLFVLVSSHLLTTLGQAIELPVQQIAVNDTHLRTRFAVFVWNSTRGGQYGLAGSVILRSPDGRDVHPAKEGGGL